MSTARPIKTAPGGREAPEPPLSGGPGHAGWPGHGADLYAGLAVVRRHW
jgi:hypothetical protein